MYRPPNKKSWEGRVDKNEGDAGYRWHQIIKCVDVEVQELPAINANDVGIVLIGFCSDEGISRNKGRVGAKEGPDKLRQVCSNLANHFHEPTLVYDVGDIVCNDDNLERAQKELENLISTIHSKGYFVFILGGGHEVAYPHFMGIRNSIPNDKTLGIMNIDAHFDLRKPDELASSGTPFYQISEVCQDQKWNFEYFVVGIQQSANTKALFNRADSLGVSYIQNSDISENSLTSVIQKLEVFIQKVDYIYLTICLDVFDISVAPGVSAPSAIGMQPGIATAIISNVIKTGKLISADIAELNPSLDQDDKTAKLASKLTFQILTEFQI